MVLRTVNPAALRPMPMIMMVMPSPIAAVRVGDEAWHIGE